MILKIWYFWIVRNIFWKLIATAFGINSEFISIQFFIKSFDIFKPYKRIAELPCILFKVFQGFLDIRQ